jgi:hypothetical protein
MTTLLAIAISMSPLLGLAGFLWIAERMRQKRDERYARQIALTDAIHRELGAVAAPTMRRRRGGRWLVTMMVPVDRPAIVAAILRITDEMFASRDDSVMESYEVVLTPRPTNPRSGAGGPRSVIGRPVRAAA